MMRSGVRYVNVAVITSYQAPLTLVNKLMVRLGHVLQSHSTAEIRFSAVLYPFEAGRLKELLTSGAHRGFHGALIANTTAADDAWLEAAKLSFPVVLMGRRIEGYSAVLSDCETNGREAAEHLSAGGRRTRLAVLRPAVLTQATQGRFDGFVAGCAELGLKAPREIVCEQFNEHAAFKAMAAALKSRRRKPDALFALSDLLAVGAYHALKQKGMKIPADIAVLGYDDLPTSRYLDPPLSTFCVPAEQFHAEAVKLLVRSILKPSTNAVQRIYQPRLIQRQSTQ